MIEYFRKKGLRNRGTKYDEPPRRLQKDMINISSIELADFGFMLIIGMIGTLSSLAVFIGEVIVGHWWR